jgi:hypothetical protein
MQHSRSADISFNLAAIGMIYAYSKMDARNASAENKSSQHGIWHSNCISTGMLSAPAHLANIVTFFGTICRNLSNVTFLGIGAVGHNSILSTY